MSHADAVIRTAAPHEIAEIEAVSVATYSQFRGEIPLSVFEGYIGELRRLADHWHEAEVLVAELGGRIRGCVLFYADASTQGLGLPQGWSGFRKLAVHPDMRGRGLGRSLTQACIDSARRRRAPTVGIHTASFMRSALRMYDAMGFRRCAELDRSASDLGLGDDGAGVKLIAYRLDLISA
jgi:ribosomal protein S18 acetylase RimI-like enzyme